MLDLRSVLAGRRVLVVEDEYLIATELVAILLAHGAEVVGPVPTVTLARRALEEGGLPDVAILDVHLGDGLVWPIAEALVAGGVPVVLATGYDAGVIPEALAHLPRCEKPSSPDVLLDMVARAVTQRGGLKS